MKSAAKTSRKISPAHARSVGASELRGNLAKYLKLAKAGTTVIIQERGRNAYVLLRFEDDAERPAFGCLRERTEYVSGAVVSAREDWRPGELP